LVLQGAEIESVAISFRDPQYELQIDGHTTFVGDSADDHKLGMKRAGLSGRAEDVHIARSASTFAHRDENCLDMTTRTSTWLNGTGRPTFIWVTSQNYPADRKTCILLANLP
jgi:hypothetical protein